MPSIHSSSRPASSYGCRDDEAGEEVDDGENETNYFGGGGAGGDFTDQPADGDDDAAHAGGGGGGDDAGLDGIPSSAMGSAATIRFQKAKLTALTTSVHSLTKELADREKELTDLKLLVKQGSDAREKLLRAKEQLEKASAAQAKQLVDLEARVATHDGEASALRREVQSQAKTRKDLDQEAKAKDAKLNRVAAELERVKEAATRAKTGGGPGGAGGSEEAAKEAANLRLANKKLLQQRADLLAGFRKQQRLIEILKKQKLHMELAKMLQFTEEEFAKCLEMGEI